MRTRSIGMILALLAVGCALPRAARAVEGAPTLAGDWVQVPSLNQDPAPSGRRSMGPGGGMGDGAGGGDRGEVGVHGGWGGRRGGRGGGGGGRGGLAGPGA